MWVLVCLVLGGFACVPEMNNPGIPWQCGGAQESLLALPVVLWVTVGRM